MEIECSIPMVQLNQTDNILAALRVEKLTKQMGEFTLEADFSVDVGERVALVGRSGSGKTTLLRILAGLELLSGPVDQGKVFLGRCEITNSPPQKREIGFVFQDQALFWNLSVMDNVTFGLRMRGVPRKEREESALTWLEKVGLKTRMNSAVGYLSGGEKQRVALIRALIWKPKLLLLDEPFSALDAELKEVLRTELIELHRLWPAPMLFVTHDEADIKSVASARLNLKWELHSPLRKVSRQLTNS